MNVIKKDNQTILRFPEPMFCISSAILGGGIRKKITTIANVTLSKDDYISIKSMKNFCKRSLTSNGYSSKDAVVLLTSVPQMFMGQSNDYSCVATVGLGNACCLDPEMVWNEEEEQFQRYNPGTINCILVLNNHLSYSAMIEGYGVAKMTIAEVIKAWSSYMGINSCVGTPTDCLAIVSASKGKKLNFAGLSTKIGSDIVVKVREAILDAIAYKYNDFVNNYIDIGKSK